MEVRGMLVSMDVVSVSLRDKACISATVVIFLAAGYDVAVVMVLRAALAFLGWLPLPLLLNTVGLALVYEETVPL